MSIIWYNIFNHHPRMFSHCDLCGSNNTFFFFGVSSSNNTCQIHCYFVRFTLFELRQKIGKTSGVLLRLDSVCRSLRVPTSTTLLLKMNIYIYLFLINLPIKKRKRKALEDISWFEVASLIFPHLPLVATKSTNFRWGVFVSKMPNSKGVAAN